VGRRTSVSQGKSAEPKPDEDQSLQVVVKREGSDAVIAQLTIPSGDTNLTTIDVLLKKTCPQTEAYQYVFRGEPVPEVFGAVILARHLGNILLIRPKRKGGVGAMAVDEPSLTDSNVLLGGVSQVNNPFRTDPAVEAARRAAKEAKEAKSKIKPRVFAKPKLTPRILASSKPPPASGAKKVPPPMPGVAGGLKANPNSASAALASGESVEAICKARAKAIFGQLP
jgi:hypothetical protein